MEITNMSWSSNIVLPVGSRVAQIVFMYTGETAQPYHGKYQSKWGALHCLKEAEIVEILSKEWTPESMLPKLWKDHESKDLVTLV